MTTNCEQPVPMTGWKALVRKVRCHLANHSTTAVTWDVEPFGSGGKRWTHTAWCMDCGRPLRAHERSNCSECGQPIRYRQPPRDRVTP